MTQNTTVVWAQFPSHEAAEKIKSRLIENGFARNSIEIYRNTDESCDLAIHTSERNLEHVESLLHISAPVYAFRQLRSGAFKAAATHPFVIGGSIALAGFILYSLLPRNRQATVHSVRELPRTLRRVPETVTEMTKGLPEAARGLSDAVSTAIGDRAPRADDKDGQR
ncbi:hypothetical protein [Microvirga arabica]|uniref:hypothetical protein n=1 Tax=Microvirga arabica TaxID=1128671 RepID=UPI00193A0914|nr:hypothetical protein [Microvirga arabica]MBM1169878.1 hypothetical protein [Microvirga arabica]